MKFRLSEEDSARIGCPRDVEYDETKLMGREAIALKKLTGWTVERLGLAFDGMPVLDDDGRQTFATDETGGRVKDPAGNPVPLRAVDPEVILVAVWLAVRRAVGDVPWRDFDIDLLGMEFVEDEPGKAPSPTASKRSTSGTSPRLRTRSASRRGTNVTA